MILTAGLLEDLPGELSLLERDYLLPTAGFFLRFDADKLLRQHLQK
jgi:hypothetical protein